MQNSSSSVRVARDPRPEDAYRSPLEAQHEGSEDANTVGDSLYHRRTQRGVLWGAGIGFMLGLLPLLMSTMMGAIAGLLISRASRLRVDRVSPPSVHFAMRPQRASHPVEGE